MFRALAFVLLFLASNISIFSQEVVFEDKFEGGLKPGWTWLRENSSARRFVDNSLEIQMEPFGENEARNALVRPLDFFRWDGSKRVGAYCVESEFSLSKAPTRQFQQCGIYWLQNDRVAFKLALEFVDGKTCIFPGKVPIDSTAVRARVTVVGQNVVAEFCNKGESNFRRVYEGRLETTPNDKIGLQCWNGPTDDPTHWVRFNYFRVEKISD